MTTQKSNTPNSGLIELSKIRESMVDGASTAAPGLDHSLLAEHVPQLRAEQPRRRRSALGIATAASMVLGLTSAAYALHHEVTQHMFVAPVSALTTDKPRQEPAALTYATPQHIALPAPDPEALQPAEVDSPVSVATASTARSSVRRTSTRPPSAPTSSDTPRSSDSSSIEALLHAATGGQVTPREGATRPADSTLPMRPARADVSSSFRGVTRAVQACGEGGEGVVSARANVHGTTGRVRSVSVSGVSGEAARCMERALMGIQLDPFQQDSLEITFPYRL